MTAVPPIAVPDADGRTIIEEVLTRSFAQSDAFHHEARAFRNRLVIMTGISMLTATTIVVLQWRLPEAAIIHRPGDAHGIARWAMLLVVMAFGCVGAMITSIPAIATIPRVQSPFNFPLQQAFLKIMIGSLTALVGVIVTSTAGITKGIASFQALVSIAVVFGAAQQAITQLLDSRAKEIIKTGETG